jgi:hypothetical protein
MNAPAFCTYIYFFVYFCLFLRLRAQHGHASVNVGRNIAPYVMLMLRGMFAVKTELVYLLAGPDHFVCCPTQPHEVHRHFLCAAVTAVGVSRELGRGGSSKGACLSILLLMLLLSGEETCSQLS